MTSLKNSLKRSERISLTLSVEELAQWQFYNNRESLSAFIRDAVNNYIEQREDSRDKELAVKEKIDQNFRSIQKIEEDLIEIQVALAKKDILPEIEFDTQMHRFLENQLRNTNLTEEDRKMFAKIQKKIR